MKLREPLLSEADIIDKRISTTFTPYNSAGFLSRATWTWMNGLLKEGYESPFKFEDVPGLASSDSAESMYKRFESNLPKNDSENQEGWSNVRTIGLTSG
ncbi:hypothetical protein AMTRI_Chr02g222830 [Amborella trichopoda]